MEEEGCSGGKDLLTLLNLTRDGTEAQISPLKAGFCKRLLCEYVNVGGCGCGCAHMFVCLRVPVQRCLNKFACLHVLYADTYGRGDGGTLNGT